MIVVMRAIDSIRPYERNPRKNEAAISKIALSISAFGFRQPIVVDESGVIIAGHTRFEAAKLLGHKEVPVHVAEGLSPEQITAYRIADNRLGEESKWDRDLLRRELADLEIAGYDLSFTTFSDFELTQIAGREGGESLPESKQPSDMLSFGKTKLVLGRGEKQMLLGALESYIAQFRRTIGFADWLCEGKGM